MRTATLITLVLLTACRKDDGPGKTDGTEPVEPVDADGDGYPEEEDCDDEDASVNPGAEEACDDIDNDCDGEIDEDLKSIWYLDADGDGFGNDVTATEACDAPSDYVLEAGDCDDADVNSYPEAPERCDEADNDCDGDVDEDVTELWYADADGDTYGNPDLNLDSCDPPAGFVADDTDCDDGEAAAYPGNEEVCDEIDNDCDAEVDEEVQSTFYLDTDGDGFGDLTQPVEACELPGGASANSDDCDDGNAAVSPVATELCDSIDNDCDELTDEDDAADAGTWYADTDGDGFGDAAVSSVACAAPSDTVADDTDCDDGDRTINPDATEVCDGEDNNCDGITDRVDADADGYVAEECGGADCDDGDNAINPGATEVWYDGTDSDCSGGSDYDQDLDGYTSDDYGGTDCDDTVASTNPGASDAFYDGVDADCDGASDYDADGDGYDSDAYGGTDCNDANSAVNPGATDTPYDGVDSDCDGFNDYDADEDGYVSTTYGGADCNDGDAAINPAATEIWYNGTDENCDGNDNDQDGDGFVADSVGGGLDCDDTSAAVNPNATEVCLDGIDNNCDGRADGCGVYGEQNAASAAHAIIRGETANDHLTQGDPGFDGIGDMNADGFDDFVLGALLEDSGGTSAGAAYVFYGPITGTTTAATADAKFTGEASADFLGARLAGVGDVNNDGFDDMVLGAVFDDDGGTNAGAAYVVLGPVSGTASVSTADAKWFGEAANDYAAEAAWTGDLNNDGLADFIIGAENGDGGAADSGTAYVLFGPATAGGSLANADVIISGEATGDSATSSLWGAGDVNDDGFNDIIIAAKGESTGGIDTSGTSPVASGAAYLVLGPVTSDVNLASADAKWLGPDAGSEIGFGVSVSTAGDTNNDGYDDIVIGARRSGPPFRAGGAYVILGPVSTGTSGTLDLADAQLIGEAVNDFTGESVHGPGDVNNDGFDDILLGSGYNDAAGTDAGALYVVNGPVSGTVALGDADAIVRAEAAGDRSRVHGVGDVDADGFDDVMMGSMLNDGGGPDAGAAYLFLGSDF